jgi:hypothetical protein
MNAPGQLYIQSCPQSFWDPGNMTISGSSQSYIDFTTSGSSYSDIAYGTFLDASCLNACNDCSPGPFSFQPDPLISNPNSADDLKKRQIQKDSTDLY